MSSGGGNETTKLVVTALGAAVAGAALGIAALKLTEPKWNQHPQQQHYDTYQIPRHSIVVAGDAALDLSEGLLMPHNHEEKMRRKIAARALVEEDNFHPRESVTVRVPATSANMGPGCKLLVYIYISKEKFLLLPIVWNEKERKTDIFSFIILMLFTFAYRGFFAVIPLSLFRTLKDDTLGMAVNLWSEVTVERAEKFEITAEGEGAEEMPKDESNLLVLGCQKAFEAANKEMPILKYHVVSRIPYARGLGSSSAAIVAGIIAGLVLAGHRLPCWGSEALLQIAAGIEVRRIFQ